MRLWVVLQAIVLLTCGCASRPVVTRSPLSPLDDADPAWLEGAGGCRLYTRIVPPQGAPRAVVWFVLGPEIGSAPLYPRLTAALEEAGIAWSVLHPRGAGYSDGPRGDIEDYALVLGDYQQFLAHLRDRFPSTPLLLMGHSAGGALALEVAANARVPLAGVVLVNPAYKLRYGEGMGPSLGDYFVYAFNYLFRASVPTVDMNSNPSLVPNDEDRAEAEAMQRDPLVVRFFSMRYLLAQKGVMDRCAASAGAIRAPLLLIEGRHDALVDPLGSDEILAASPSLDKHKLVAPHGAHGSSAVETMVPALLDWLRAHALPEPAIEGD